MLRLAANRGREALVSGLYRRPGFLRRIAACLPLYMAAQGVHAILGTSDLRKPGRQWYNSGARTERAG